MSDGTTEPYNESGWSWFMTLNQKPVKVQRKIPLFVVRPTQGTLENIQDKSLMK